MRFPSMWIVQLALFVSTAFAFTSIPFGQTAGSFHRDPWNRNEITARTTTTTSTTSTSPTTCISRRPTHCSAYKHALAILSMPTTSLDKIANEAILERVLSETRTLSVVLRCQDKRAISTATLRRYVGELYSQLWDVALGADQKGSQNPDLPDVVVYPQNLPNAAPESWIDILPDLDCICSHDSIVGWRSTSSSSSGSGAQRYEASAGNGRGGLDEHVANVNRERAQRKLEPVQALHVEDYPVVATEECQDVVFVDDEVEKGNDGDSGKEQEEDAPTLFLSGAIPSENLYESVCVGGTFDGLHFGHRKLLSLAVSSVHPVTGTLLVGVTVDEMLQKKTFAEHIPTFEERCKGVRQFLDRLAPGMINRVSISAIKDSFGPPGQPDSNEFDALVLSHETLDTGYLLNRHRVTELGLPPLKLLCTRRTEAHGMSSTALRRIRQQIKEDASVLSEK